jgi:hypothetical protein
MLMICFFHTRGPAREGRGASREQEASRFERGSVYCSRMKQGRELWENSFPIWLPVARFFASRARRWSSAYLRYGEDFVYTLLVQVRHLCATPGEINTKVAYK